MISDFDDYPVHQVAAPVNEPGPSDRNFYDRYWFNGFDREGGFNFEIGFGIYPNRRVMDAHFSIAQGGRQYSFHGSRRAPLERSDLVVGPLRIEVTQPMRSIRVRLSKNESGLECDLGFLARTAPTQEPNNLMYDEQRVIMHTCRFVQFGAWQGSFEAAGRRTHVEASRTLGTRDRSWGVRPVGEPESGAPGRLTSEPAVYWVWSPIHFDDICTQFRSFEDPDGSPAELGAAMCPAYATMDDIPRDGEPGHRDMQTASHRIDWLPGTRRPRAAVFELVERGGKVHTIRLEPMNHFQMLGIGYQHPEWGHGVWKGEELVGYEEWALADLDPLDYKHIHVHEICRATMGDRTGVGTLETICFGRHVPSGFQSLLDGAP